jgi:hypothetical protein
MNIPGGGWEYPALLRLSFDAPRQRLGLARPLLTMANQGANLDYQPRDSREGLPAGTSP